MNTHSPKTIMLVEDEILIAMGETVVIEKYGFTVVMAHNGKHAIELAQTNPDIDLILMDIDLGAGPDGTQAAAKILEFRELPIVFLTGHSEKEMVDKVKKITRYGYVLKHSGEFVLIEAINMAFELFEAHQRAEAENKKLQASERKFRTMYQFSKAGIARLGLDSRIEQANPTYCRMLGYTEAELIGKSISDITHPDDLPENLEKQRRLGRGAIDNFTMEKRFIHKDGRTVYGLLNANLVRDHQGNPEYFLGNVVDITAKKNAEEALLQRESFHRTLLSNISDSIFITDEQGTLTYICPNVEHNFGYSHQEMEQINNINQLLGDHIFGSAELVEKGELINIERTVAIKGGQCRTLLINVKLILSGILYICRDITDRKRAEEALEKRKKFNESILNSVTAHIAVLDKHGVIIAVNQAWRQFAADNGMPPEVGLGQNYFSICEPTSDAATTIEGMKAVLTGEQSRFSIEYPCHSPTEKRWFWLHVVPLQTDEGGLVVSHINITDHKKTMEELHKYKHMVSASPDSLSLVDCDYFYRAVSDEYLRRTEKHRPDIVDHHVAAVMGQAVFETIIKPELDRCFNGETVRYQTWFDFAGIGRRFIDVTYTPYRGNQQTISGALVSARDITELAEVQEQVHQNQRTLRALIDAADDSILLIKPDGEIIECNQTVAYRFGKERQKLIGTNTFDLATPAVTEHRQAWTNKVFESGKPVQFEDVRHGRDIRNIINPVLNEQGEVEALAIFGSDITEQKQAATAIQSSEMKQRAILQAIPDLMFTLTADGQILDFKVSDLRDLVLKPKRVSGSYIQASFPPETADVVLQAIKTTIETGELQTFEYKLPVRQGIQDFEARLVRLDSHQALAIVRNVTQQKQTEQALIASEEKYRLLYENMAQGAFYQRADGTHLDVNPAALEIFGLTRDEFLGRTSLTPEWRVIREDGTDFPGEEHPSMMALKTGKPVYNVTAGIYNPRKEDTVWVSTNAIPQFRPGEDKPYQVIVTLHDMTELKQAELALRQSKEKYQLLSENSTDVIAYLDHTFRLKYVSPSCFQLTGYSQAELMPINMFDIIHPDDRDSLRHSIMTDIGNKVESSINAFRVRHKEGHTVWVESVSTRFFDETENLQYIVVNERDITDRKRAEEKVQSLLVEKELLLQEIHHRIKNDMTAVSSILQLHAAASANPDTVQALKEAQSRVNILGNIYEKLYADQDFRNIQLKQFLNSLVTNIARSHADPHVSITADIEAMAISAKQSFYIGIVINELVTNACKYAFPDKDNGEISVTVRRLDDKLEIVVSDNGVGFQFQSGEKKKKTGFGCMLIKALVAQYRGSMEIDAENGVTAKILLTYSP